MRHGQSYLKRITQGIYVSQSYVSLGANFEHCWPETTAMTLVRNISFQLGPKLQQARKGTVKEKLKLGAVDWRRDFQAGIPGTSFANAAACCGKDAELSDHQNQWSTHSQDSSAPPCAGGRDKQPLSSGTTMGSVTDSKHGPPIGKGYTMGIYGFQIWGP